MTTEENPGAEAGREGAKSITNRIRAIVADGSDVRSKVADAVREASAMVHETGETLGDISRSVIDEAVGAASDEAEAGSVLREVIDGVGDGFGSAAQAVDLALAEARSKGHEFASDDISSVAEDLRSIGGLLVETTGKALRGVGGHLKEQAGDITEHAERTAKRMKPGLESAASAVAGDVKGAVKQTAKAGVAAARQGTGTLFSLMGSLLQKTGDVIKVHSDDEKENGDEDDDQANG